MSNNNPNNTNQTLKKQSHIKILSWNINSLNTNYAELLGHLQINKYDIIALQETQVSKKDKFKYNIPGYKIYHHYQNNLLNKHGLLIAINKNIPTTYISNPHANTNQHQETLIINIHLPQHTIQIQNIYFSPSIKTKDFKPTFTIDPNIPTILVGDFNAHHSNWCSSCNISLTNNIKSRKLNKTNHNLQILNNPKIRTTILNHTIDLALATTSISNNIECKVDNTILSDIHYGSTLNLNLTQYSSKNDFIPRFKLDEADWDKYQEQLNIEFNKLNIYQSNIKLKHIEHIFTKAANKVIPKTKFHPSPWKAWFWHKDCYLARKNFNKALLLHKKQNLKIILLPIILKLLVKC